MVAIKVYAFGGLAFMIGVVLTAISYWFWTVLVRREFADSPPSLELHPEVRLSAFCSWAIHNMLRSK